jgi:hypothetical protein
MNDIAGKLREHGKVFDEMAERHLRHHYEDIRAQGLEQAVLANAFHAGGDEIDRLQREMAEARAEAGRLKSCNLELAVKAGRLDAENERLKAALKDMTQRVVASWERRDLAPDGDLEAVEAAEKLY